MKKGLVLGKFMPLHKGHLALINFSLGWCDQLTVLLCHHRGEPISGCVRENWLRACLSDNPQIRLMTHAYDPQQLTESSSSTTEDAVKWAETIRQLIPDVGIFFSSEPYGETVAAYLNAEHRMFDKQRTIVPVSASLIRQKPITYRHFLPKHVQSAFIKKIALVGTESTGKSTLADRLARHYQTTFVPEMAREIISHTNDCTPDDLLQIATLHAQTILQKSKEASALLFCDTEINITKSYSRFLFQKELEVPEWIEEANRCDLYLFLDSACPFVQDGTRLSEAEREALNEAHKQQMEKAKIPYVMITGGWETRFTEACNEIDKFIRRY